MHRVPHSIFVRLLTAVALVGVPLSAQNSLRTFYGDSADDEFGRTVDGAGDVNQDGYDDLIVGVAFNDDNGVSAGCARILSGADGSILYTFYGDSAGDVFGGSVGGAGDVNQDGYADVIVGAQSDDDNGDDSGSARVFSGLDGSILYTFYGDSAGDVFGVSVAGAGDVNQDGSDDLIVGAMADDNNGASSGSARIFSGADGSILYTFHGDSPGDLFGGSVHGAGDVNRDGHADVIVGASFDDDNGVKSGSARVFSGIDGSILHTFYGDSRNDLFGGSVAGAGDVNRDGSDDLIVGAHFDDDNGADSGSARVFSGLDGSILYTFYGDSAGDAFGGSVAGAGDVNQDGYPDLIAGAQWDDDNGISSGSARVFSGADGAVLYTFYGDSAHDCFGVSVAGAGDVNKDGYADLIVGAHLDDDNGSNSGSARVISGLGCCPSTGQSCTVAPCESCPSIVATTSGGAPTLNNGSFALELVNAPSNLSYAILAISDTPCESPGTSYIFCDTIKVHQPLAFLAAMLFTAGVSPCTTSITVPAGIPNDPTFLGFALGVQWALSCDAGTVLGASISNCVSMVVTDT